LRLEMTKKQINKRYAELANSAGNIRVIDRTNGFFDLDRQAWTRIPQHVYCEF